MPIAQMPYKIKCPKCGYSKIIRPKSDVLDPREFIQRCPKCDVILVKCDDDIGLMDEITNIFK